MSEPAAMSVSDAPSELEQWDLVTHASSEAQNKNDKLASTVYHEIKGLRVVLKHCFTNMGLCACV